MKTANRHQELVKSEVLTIRLTKNEKEQLIKDSDTARQVISEYVRSLIFKNNKIGVC